ncbi:23S rRNA (guanosine-2'-O-) -methyltransferase rlmB [Clostridiaceae bacterium JG1575]|nr:23S rRNA (guanosine-2'-O-) -methyltransferase rlmB [Clostridiaceae bacterium JG1575]
MNFPDIQQWSTQEKEAMIQERYGGTVHFAGRRHPAIERVVALNQNLKANPKRLVAAEGIWALKLARKFNIRIQSLILCPALLKTPEAQELIAYFVPKAEECLMVSDRLYAQLAEKENGQGLLGVFYLDFTSFAEFQDPESSLLLVLDGLEIPGNVGTILRSAEATGCDGVVLTHRKVRITHPKLLRSSMGALFKVPIMEEKDPKAFLEALQKRGYEIILADTESQTPYFDLAYKGRVALVMGSEKYGISAPFYEVAHQDVMIPMLGELDSLNVGVAATILLYEAALKNKQQMQRSYK